MKLSVRQLRKLITEEIKKVVKEDYAYGHTMGWGTKELGKLDPDENEWHVDKPVFKKFMEDMFGITSPKKKGKGNPKKHAEPDGDEGPLTVVNITGH